MVGRHEIMKGKKETVRNRGVEEIVKGKNGFGELGQETQEGIKRVNSETARDSSKGKKLVNREINWGKKLKRRYE